MPDTAFQNTQTPPASNEALTGGIIGAARAGRRVLPLRRGHNLAPDERITLPWPDAIGLDIDGVQADIKLYVEHVFGSPIVAPHALRLLKGSFPVVFSLTNRAEETAIEYLQRSELLPYNTAVFGTRPDVPLKPHPFLMMRAVRELGLQGKKILYAGDSQSDMEFALRCAREEGIETIPVGILGPGLRSSRVIEEKLVAAGAVAVYASLHHLIADLLEAKSLSDALLEAGARDEFPPNLLTLPRYEFPDIVKY